MSHKKWLRDGLTKPGKSQAGLARFTGWNSSVVSRMASDKGRPLRAYEVDKIAEYFGESTTGVRYSQPPDFPGVALAPVRGIAMEDVWRERGIIATPVQHHERNAIPIIPDPEFPAKAHYMLAVGEHSNNDEMVLAEYYVCVPIGILDRNIRKNDKVHLEQVRECLVRTLVRRVEIKGATMAYAPLRSSGKAIDADAAEVKGIVLGHLTRYRV